MNVQGIGESNGIQVATKDFGGFTPEEIATANSILSDNLHLTNNTEKVCNDFVNTVMARITKSGKMLDLLVAA